MGIDLDALIQKAREQFDDVQPVDQGIIVGGELVVARVRPLRGADWRELVAHHPPRVEESDGEVAMVKADQGAGCNLDTLVPDYPGISIVEDGGEVPVEPGQWREICGVLSGPSLEALGLAIWGMNVWEPTQRLSEAGKA